MNNGINFSADGPIIEGTWQNMDTGDVFEVRDFYIQDGVFTVQATDGRIFDYNTLQNYVKVDKPIPVQPKNQIKQPKQLPSELAAELESVGDLDILPEDAQLINKSYEGSPVLPEQLRATVQVEDDDIKLINRVLARVKTVPEFDYKISWKNFPSKQMEMLVDYMGVPVEKICNYYIEKMSIEEIRNMLTYLLVNHIEKQLDGSANEPKETKPKNAKK